MIEGQYNIYSRIMHSINALDFMTKCYGGWVAGKVTSWQVNNTDIVLILRIVESWQTKSYHLTREWLDNSEVIDFDEVLNRVPADIQTKLLFNLDLFK